MSTSGSDTAETYAEWAPPARLEADVQCLWWSSFGGSAMILPDGHLDLVVGEGRAFIAGPDTQAVANTMPEGLKIHGIRFRTGRAQRILGVPSDELRDRRVDLTDLWGGAEGRRATERLIASPRALLELVDERLAGDPVDPDREIDHAVRVLAAERPRVADLHHEIGLSERQLRRRFTAAVGYGPATFLRVRRLQRARHLALENPLAGLADIAMAAGYADQAHMSREIKNITGRTARALLRGDRSVQDGAGSASLQSGS